MKTYSKHRCRRLPQLQSARTVTIAQADLVCQDKLINLNGAFFLSLWWQDLQQHPPLGPLKQEEM